MSSQHIPVIFTQVCEEHFDKEKTALSEKRRDFLFEESIEKPAKKALLEAIIIENDVIEIISEDFDVFETVRIKMLTSDEREILYKMTVFEQSIKSLEKLEYQKESSAHRLYALNDEDYEKKLKDILFDILLLAIDHGFEKLADHLLTQFPEFLTKRAAVKNKWTGNTIEDATPLDVAYTNGDPQMCNMIIEHFKKIENGPSIASKQLEERFPESKEEEEKQVYDFNPLIDVIDLHPQLDLANHPDDIKTILDQFHNDFAPKTFKKGRNLTINDLLRAFTVYNEKFKGWNSSQRDFFWRYIIGFIESRIPACDMQAFCQQLNDVAKKGQKLDRKYVMVWDNRQNPGDSIPFYSTDLNSHSGLGFSLAVHTNVFVFATGGCSPVATRTWDPLRVGVLKTYVEQKLMSLDELEKNCRLHVSNGLDV